MNKGNMYKKHEKKKRTMREKMKNQLPEREMNTYVDHLTK
jgi:hypothetical protein